MKLLALSVCGIVFVWIAMFFGVVVEVRAQAQSNNPVYVPPVYYSVTPVPTATFTPTPTPTATFTPTPTPTP